MCISLIVTLVDSKDLKSKKHGKFFNRRKYIAYKL